MKSYLTVSVLALVAMFVTDAQALFTACRINYQTQSVGLLVAEVGSGTGVAICKDAVGNQFITPFKFVTAGPALAGGYCETEGRILAAGPGFALSEILSVMGQVEIGPRHFLQKGIGVGLDITPVGFNAKVSLVGLRFKNPETCYGLASLKLFGESSLGKTRRYKPRVNPPVTLPPPVEQQNQQEILR